MKIVNALTIDVEDYFQVSAFAPYIDRAAWDHCECRVERNVDVILAMLEEAESKATFFTLGWVAERYPRLIKRIFDSGHEVASHGYGHQRVSELTPDQFREDVVRAKSLLEDLTGIQVKGYRAPSFSVGASNQWAFDVLAETGHLYSSSVYPISHDHYGIPNWPRFARRVRSGILEIPPTTFRCFGRNFPSSGGGYFRLFPYELSRWLIEQVNKRDGQPAIFYFHPWELDLAQPRVDQANTKAKFRHYINIEKVPSRIEKLLQDFSWGRMDEIFLPLRAGSLTEDFVYEREVA